MALITAFHCVTWAETLQDFTKDLFSSIKTVDDLKKNNKKIRIRTHAEIQNIQSHMTNKGEMSALLDLLYVSSLLNAAENLNRTSQVQQQWNAFLKANQQAKISLDSAQLPKVIGVLKANSDAQLTRIIPDFFQSMPDEVYFQMDENSLLRHCAVLIMWSQTKPAFRCLEKIEKHFVAARKQEFMDELQSQKLHLFLLTHDKDGVQNFLKTNSKPEDQKNEMIQLYGVGLDFLQGNSEAVLKKAADLGPKVKTGNVKFTLVVLKAQALALQKKFADGIQVIDKVIEARKEKKQSGKDSEQRLLFIQASLYIGDKKPAKALEILDTMETYPKSINHLQSILIDTYKCGLWQQQKMKNASGCADKAKTYSDQLQGFKETDPYTLTALEMMKHFATGDQAKLQETKNKILKVRNAADPLVMILSP